MDKKTFTREMLPTKKTQNTAVITDKPRLKKRLILRNRIPKQKLLDAVTQAVAAMKKIVKKKQS